MLTQNRIGLKSSMTRGALLLILFSSIIWARGFSPDIDDSLRNIPPKMRAEWLKLKEIDDSRYTTPFFPDSQNVRMVGKWGRGPSVEVTGKDSLVFVSLGSEVAIVQMANTGNPQLITEIQTSSLVYNSILKDSLLYIGALGEIEIWNVSNPTVPIFRNRVQTVLNDIFVKDTFLYVIAEDSLKIFNVRNISNPYLAGASRDSGNTIFVSNNYAYLGDRWGLYILNVSNPQNPYWVSTLSGGQNVDAIWVEDGHCYYTTSNNGLIIANVQNPNNPWQEGNLSSIGGLDIYKSSYFLYLPNFDIVDVSNPSFPSIVSHLDLPGWEMAIWVKSPFSYAFIADHWEGLQIVNINDPVYPVVDTGFLGAEDAMDIVVDSQKAYLADYTSMKIIDVSDHSRPYELGSYDTTNWRPWLYSVAVKDSFAYIGDLRWNDKFRSIDISNPANPIIAGLVNNIYRPQDMVIKDSLIYIAENNCFQIVSISNPHQPRLVGSCNSIDVAGGLSISGNYAYVTGSGWTIIDISNPANPIRVITLNQPRGMGIAIKDTFAYFVHSYDSLIVWSIANPYYPYQIISVNTRTWPNDIVVKDTFAYVGGRYGLQIFNISNPIYPQEVGHYATPDYVRRLFCDDRYIYAACFSGGMCILENSLTGIEEKESYSKKNNNLIICNAVTNGRLRLKGVNNGVVIVYNVIGKEVYKNNVLPFTQELDLSNLPDGCYLIFVKEPKSIRTGKVIKIK